MSPYELCPKCGKWRPFHKKELKRVRKGKVFCVDCTLDRGYDEFLGEVLAGEHKDTIAILKERLEEEAE